MTDIGKKYKISEFKLKELKMQIMKGYRINAFGDYECGCAINPKFNTINKLCKIHQRVIQNA